MPPKRDPAIKDIENQQELETIIAKCKICHVGFSADNKPYVLGFNFGYHQQTIYLHTLGEGKKMQILAQNPEVCVAFDTDHNIFARHEQVACSYRMAYRSVLAYGKAEIVTNYDEKMFGLKTMMSHYAQRDFKFSKPAVDNITIIKIPVRKMTGRTFEY